MTWEPFRPAEKPLPTIRWLKKFGGARSAREAREMQERFKPAEVWLNNLYEVEVDYNKERSMVHLSIKRRDKESIHDWRHLQRIKTELIGPECEGIELYPAESRLIDGANQYHLWVFTDPTYRMPIGFKSGRGVNTPEQAAAMGAKQRAFKD